MTAQTPSTAIGSISVRTISETEHSAFAAEHPTSSFLQNPRWPKVKNEWRGESLGFFAGEDLIGTALVLYRPLPIPSKVPVLGSKSLAYMAEGPVFNQDAHSITEFLPAVTDYLKAQGAFLIRMGLPGVVRRWEGKAVRKALSDSEYTIMTQLEPLELNQKALDIQQQLKSLGWQAPSTSGDFDAGQPRYQARIPLIDDTGNSLDIDGVLKRMNSTSRNLTRKSTRTDLTVLEGGYEDLAEFHALYVETSEREEFTPRPLEYFQRLYTELNASAVAQCKVLLARFQDLPLAASLFIRQGEVSWYSYSGSTVLERKREAPRALQLKMFQDSLEAGCRWYDLGGVSPSLKADSPLAGLTIFKTQVGCDVFETHGEWDFDVNKPLAKAFKFYMARR